MPSIRVYARLDNGDEVDLGIMSILPNVGDRVALDEPSAAHYGGWFTVGWRGFERRTGPAGHPDIDPAHLHPSLRTAVALEWVCVLWPPSDPDAEAGG